MARINLEAMDVGMGGQTSKSKSKAKEPVEYVNGKGWVDEDGNVVEAETGKARNRRALELVDNTLEEHEAWEKAEREQQGANGSMLEDARSDREAEKKSKKRKHTVSVVVEQKDSRRQSSDANTREIPESPETRERPSTQEAVDRQLEAEQQPWSKKLRVEEKPENSHFSNNTSRASLRKQEQEPPETSSGSKLAPELHTEKPSAVFKPRKARDWTVTIALPGSILNNVARHDVKTLLVGRIARAAAVWCVDEIVVYDDEPSKIPDKVSSYYRGRGKSKQEVMDSISDADIPYQNPDRFMVGLLEYADCPPHLRSALFPMCEPYKYVGLLPPLDTPSHTKPDEWIRFREGVALEPQQRVNGIDWTYINCGLPYPVKVPYSVPPGMRLTVEFKDPSPPPSWPYLSEHECAALSVDAATPEAPREQEGYYWGYKVRKAPSFSSVFTESDYPSGYSFVIGTSERGAPLRSILPAAIAPSSRRVSPDTTLLPDVYKHLLVVFGGVAGLEPVVAGDASLGGMRKEDAHKAFDYWVNLVEGQGSRTVRTEEAVEIGLAGLKAYMDYQYEAGAVMREEVEREGIWGGWFDRAKGVG